MLCTHVERRPRSLQQRSPFDHYAVTNLSIRWPRRTKQKVRRAAFSPGEEDAWTGSDETRPNACTLQATNYSNMMAPEGQCHAAQSLAAPHYHHISQCMDIILDWNVKESQVQGQGITMFIKLGVFPFYL